MIEDIGCYLVTGYFVFMSFLGFILMAVDKHRAKNGAWRIPERTLIGVALIGGGIGSMLGMYILRHKTKHLKFRVVLPLSAILTIVLMVELVNIFWFGHL